ncbi:DGQHR domain-containing protein [Brevundimonas sp. SL130]|uniref:DGQHR domain-containing protein n=1 Tax=Brevundimonas sp. SL130 TaxID=2995143 RepID=UPI00226C6BD0|nr:DGQHR domain-containing protein [Brevundimonas sp. SL130]WAC59651.1 DGQHR domain-containing protein [Brevundimonas sp. SL130]
MAVNGQLFLPALQGAFGDWTYYTALMNLSDLVARVGYASQIQSNDKLSDLMQRALDDQGRGADIARYLEATPARFFNALVVGVQGGAPSWHPFGLSSSLADHDLGTVIERDQDLVGYLQLRGDETLFALDGQHRLSGIRTALNDGVKIENEKVSVIFVPHIPTVEGLRRTRGLFISLNKKVVPVKRKDIIILDEVDLPAIITRQLLDEHPWFSRGQVDFDRFGNALPATSDAWTTIGNFYDVNKAVIGSVIEGRRAEELKDAERNRLPDDRIAFYKDGVIDFYKRLAALDPILKSAFEGNDVSNVCRAARTSDSPHLLFRPVGLKMIVRTAAELRKSKSVASTFKELGRVPILMDEKPFSETIWDTDRDRMDNKGESLGTRLLAYMLGLSAADEKLRQSYADWRGVEREGVRLPNRFPPA